MPNKTSPPMPTTSPTPTSSLARRVQTPSDRLVVIADEMRAAADDRTRDVFEGDGTRCLMLRPAALRHWADRIEVLASMVRDA